MLSTPYILIVDEGSDHTQALLAALRDALRQCKVSLAVTWEEASASLRRGDLEVLVCVVRAGGALAARVHEEARRECASVPAVLLAAPGAVDAAAALVRPGQDEVFPWNGATGPACAAVRAAAERVQARRRASHVEARMKGVLDRVSVGIFRASPDGVLLETNPAFFRILGVANTRADVAYHLRDFCMQGEDFDADLRRVAERGQPVVLERELHRSDGQPGWVSFTLAPGLDLAGGAVIDGTLDDVTDRKKAEKALRQTRIRESHLLSSLPMVLYTARSQGDLSTTWVSENVDRVTGIPRARFLAEPGLWMSRVHPEDRDRVAEEFAALGEGSGVTVEYRWKGPGDHWLWFLDHAMLTRDAAGRTVEVLGSRLDITDRKRSETMTLELAGALENAVEGISRVDVEGAYKVANRAYAELFGYEPFELTGVAWAETIHAADRARATDALVAMRAEGKAEVEVRGLARDGASPHLELTLVRARASDEADYTGFFCFAKDVTERRRSERELRASEERFRQLAEGIREVFWIRDPRKNQMIYVSPAYEAICGRTTESACASPLAWLESVHPDDRERVLSAAISCQVHGSYEEEYRIQRPDGEVRWVRDQAFPIRGETGEVARIVGIAEDITDRRRAEETVRSKTEQLQAIAGAMAQYLSTGDWRLASAILVREAVRRSGSECGFLGVVVDGPMLRIHAQEGARDALGLGTERWDEAMRRFEEQGYVDVPCVDNVFGEVLRSAAPVILAAAGDEGGAEGPAQGLPPIRTFLGVPLLAGNQAVGLLAVANRATGYGQGEREDLEVLAFSASVMYDAQRGG